MFLLDIDIFIHNAYTTCTTTATTTTNTKGEHASILQTLAGVS